MTPTALRYPNSPGSEHFRLTLNGMWEYSSRNILSWLTQIRRSPSVNSYGMLNPRAPNLRRSSSTPWNRHSENNRCLNSVPCEKQNHNKTEHLSVPLLMLAECAYHSFTWHQPCNNQTALNHFSGYSNRAVLSSSHSFSHIRLEQTQRIVILSTVKHLGLISR